MSKSPENSQYRMSENYSKRIKHLIYENECQSNVEFAKLVGVGAIVIWHLPIMTERKKEI